MTVTFSPLQPNTHTTPTGFTSRTATLQRPQFGHDDGDKATLTTKAEGTSTGKKTYKFTSYLGFPSTNAQGKRTFGTVVRDLIIPTNSLLGDLGWALLLPPFTFIIPLIGLGRAGYRHIKKVEVPDKQAILEDKIPVNDDAKADTADSKPAEAKKDA